MRRATALVVVSALALVGCAGMSKINYAKIYSRAGWQHPDRVIESLGIRPGDHVADIGAGDGYFTFPLADAVGPTGRVYAVEVDDELVENLQGEVEKRGYSNVVVVRGEFEDPLLPDGNVHLVFLCNTYHHIEDRPVYFLRLQEDLRGNGRVAVVDMKDDLDGILALFADEGHTTPLDQLRKEMAEARYRRAESFDFLPVQHFEIFAVEPQPSGSARDADRAGL